MYIISKLEYYNYMGILLYLLNRSILGKLLAYPYRSHINQ